MKLDHLLLWLLVGLLAPSLLAFDYTIVDLGPGNATSINSSGTVAGYDLQAPRTGFTFRNGERQETNIKASFLGANPPTAYGLYVLQWYGIGDGGTLAGWAYLTNHSSPIPVFPTNYRYPILWDGAGDGVILNVTNGSARAVNASGIAVGSWAFGSTNVAFRFDGTDLGSLPSDGKSSADAINDLGVIAGFSQNRAATWSNGVVNVLSIDESFGKFGRSGAAGINNTGQTVGTINYVSLISDRILNRGFFWENGVTTLIGPGEELDTQARSLNNLGVAVGRMESFPSAPRAFIFRDGQLIDLNILIPNAGWELMEANDINDDGQIVGQGRLNGELRGFLLNPLWPGQPIPPSVVQQPVGGEFFPGTTASLSVVASGTQPLTYRWQRDGVDIAAGTNAILTLTNLVEGDSAYYQAIVFNVAGVAYTQPTAVLVKNPATTIARYAGLTITGDVGGLYRIDSSPQINGVDWSELARITLTNASQLWFDLTSGTNPFMSYYRVSKVQP